MNMTNMKMKRIITTIILLSCLLLLSSCDSSKAVTSRMQEWISPDGVHYWYDIHMMAPRYDSNGNLVIEEVK